MEFKKFFKAMFILFAILATASVIGRPTQVQAKAKATKETTKYELYPIPHNVKYEEGSFILRDINVLYGSGIDDETKARLNEVAKLKGLDVNLGTEILGFKKATNILVGIYGSKDVADKYVTDNKLLTEDTAKTLFAKIDSYYLLIKDGTIVVLGKDTDAAFYGLTTLYQIVNQLDSKTIANLTIKDYSDVKSRGFIEGYYGNPWTTDDRVALMKWAGYYKLNSYFYAPKDDEKHRTKWYELYTADELKNKIDPLIKAGNDSKCRFVFALHPFPSSNHFDFNNYEKSLQTLEVKYKQVIDRGVRQIALLADDFYAPGGANETKLLNDLTNWLKNDIKKQYPDMKTTIPFVPSGYMGNGTGDEFNSLKQTNPDDVQLVVTGGTVWGQVSKNFTDNFYNNTGRGPYLWINWPCSDNSKQHLIMGGYKEFLHSDVDPSKLQGIVLNPMQQSEPSKVAIFGNACYTWNIWTDDEADQAYQDSFKYVEHNSAKETAASKALRELSKHMINQAMDSRVVKLEESVELKDKLDEFVTKMNAGTLTTDDIKKMESEFTTLQKAAKTFRQKAKDRRLVGENTGSSEQMKPWLDCWDDTTTAVLAFLKALQADLNHDVTNLLAYNTQGQTAFSNSKKHGFKYVDSTQYAEVGVQHIIPFINKIKEYVAKEAETTLNPDAFITSYITSRKDSPVNSSVEDILDNDDSTYASYHDPSYLYTGDYVGLKFNKLNKISTIHFLLGDGKNHFDHSKVQYLDENDQWQDLKLNGMENNFTGIENQKLEITLMQDKLPQDFKAKGIRLIATQDNAKDAWLDVYDISVNRMISNAGYTTNLAHKNNTSLSVLNDGVNGTTSDSEYWLSGDGDAIGVGGYIQYNLDSKQVVTGVNLAQAGSQPGDGIADGKVQYLADDGSWKDFTNGKVTSQSIQNFDFTSQNIATTAVRIYNNTYIKKWWRIGEFKVLTASDAVSMQVSVTNLAIGDHTSINDAAKNNKLDYIIDGDESTLAWLTASDRKNNIPAGATVTLTFSQPINLDEITMKQGSDDKIINGKFEYQTTTGEWKVLNTFTNAGATVTVQAKGVKAKALRVVNTQNTDTWWKLYEISVSYLGQKTTPAYTNLENTTIVDDTSQADNIHSLTSGEVTLKNGEYIGVDFGHIQKIKDLDTDFTTKTKANLQVEISENEIEWTKVDDSSAKDKDARYVRLVNTNSQATTVTLNKFSATYEKITSPDLVDSDIAINPSYASGDMRNMNNAGAAFDGDLTTTASINGYPTKGSYILFDLGQTRTINKLRYYINETNQNYIRDAVFEVADSPDAKTWTPILTIGNGQDKNTWDDSTAKEYGELTHDEKNPGNMYKEGSVTTPAKGRYLRVRFTASCNFRFVTFGEIQINGGEYVSTESHQDIQSKDIEEPSKIPSNMIDGDYTTSYKSSATNSNFVYTLSKPTGVRSLRIVQMGQISNAQVSAVVYTKAKSQDTKEIDLGTLNQTITEFVLPEDYTLKQVKVSWKDTIPEILEISTGKDYQKPDNQKLSAYVAQVSTTDTSSWTKDSQSTFNAALSVAKQVVANEYASQATIDLAYDSLKNAVDQHIEKYSRKEIAELLANKIDNSKGYYTAASYQDYLDAYDDLNNAYQDKDNLDATQAQALISALTTAKTNLKYSSLLKEDAQLLLDAQVDLQINKDNYTQASYQAYQNALAALQKAITAQDMQPQGYDQLISALQTSYNGLVDISVLQHAIAQFGKYDANLYTPQSYQAYQAAIAKAKELLLNGSAQDIKQQLALIQDAIAKLVKKAVQDNSNQAIDNKQPAKGTDNKTNTQATNNVYQVVATKPLQAASKQATASATQNKEDVSQEEQPSEDTKEAKSNHKTKKAKATAKATTTKKENNSSWAVPTGVTLVAIVVIGGSIWYFKKK